jgi:hypothetical protein
MGFRPLVYVYNTQVLWYYGYRVSKEEREKGGLGFFKAAFWAYVCSRCPNVRQYYHREYINKKGTSQVSKY